MFQGVDKRLSAETRLMRGALERLLVCRIRVTTVLSKAGPRAHIGLSRWGWPQRLSQFKFEGGGTFLYLAARSGIARHRCASMVFWLSSQRILRSV